MLLFKDAHGNYNRRELSQWRSPIFWEGNQGEEPNSFYIHPLKSRRMMAGDQGEKRE
jgi:hypothetical protein